MDRLETCMHELEDFEPGDAVLTPTGRRAVVKKLLAGASKTDAFPRVLCRYEGDDDKDLVTLQPYLLRFRAEGQMCLEKADVGDSFAYGIDNKNNQIKTFERI